MIQNLPHYSGRVNHCRETKQVLVRSRRHSRGSILLLLMMSIAPSATSGTFFVAPDGNPRNSGLTKEAPYGSINQALNLCGAGDTVYLLEGTYRELIRISEKQGRPENPICLLGYSPSADNYPLIDVGAVEPSSDASNDWIHIKESSWIEIGRMKFRNGWTFPIKVKQSSYITFRDCLFWGGKRVINASGTNTHHILVEDCFWDQGGKELWTIVEDTNGVRAWTSMHHGSMAYYNGSLIDFSGTSGSMVIRRNTIVNAFNAVRYRGQKGCDSNVEIYENQVSQIRDNDFEPEYYTYNLHIYHNVSHNIHRTLSVDDIEGGLIYYYGNVVTADTDSWSEQVCSGIWKLHSHTKKLSYPLYAFNNSFYAIGIAFQRGCVPFLRHVNNAYIFRSSGGWQLDDLEESDEFDYDISNKSWSATLTDQREEQHGIIADIRYEDPGNGNLRLQKNSPGIDAGTIVKISENDWAQEFAGKAPDVGAYENGQLVEGPPFRIMDPPEGILPYKEKPRIVRAKVIGKSVMIFFSDKISPMSVRKEDVEVFEDNRGIDVSTVELSPDRYAVIIGVKEEIDMKALSLAFKKMPRGMNGEEATYWASAMHVHKRAAQEH